MHLNRKIMTCVVLLALAGLWVGGRAVAATPETLAHEICSGLARSPHDPALTGQLRTLVSRMEDPAAKAKFGTLYALSMLAGGHPAGLQLQAYLTASFPDSPYTRLVALPYSSHVCAACEGSTIERRACDRCTGSGSCPDCNGTGFSRMRGFDGALSRCMICQGTKQCQACGGKGTVEGPCRQCREGYVPSSLRAEASYHDLLLHLIEGTGLPEVMRAASIRMALNAADSAAEQATLTTDAVTREAAARRARAQAAAALDGTVVTVHAPITGTRAISSGRVEVRLGPLEQLAPQYRDDRHLHAVGWTMIELQATPREATALRTGETLRISGPATFVPYQPGHAEFPEPAYAVATLWIQANAASRILIGTIVMRNAIAAAGTQVFHTPR